MRVGLRTTAALALLGLVGVTNALYFHIAETERKCFIEEIPEETMVQGKACAKNIALFWDQGKKGDI